MDRDTGKPKGFGFCEFHSKDDAESAYRNLNNTMFKGRQIRIDFAEENMSDRGYKGGYKDRGEYSVTPSWRLLLICFQQGMLHSHGLLLYSAFVSTLRFSTRSAAAGALASCIFQAYQEPISPHDN